MADLKLTYSIGEAMRALGICRSTIYREINSGRLRTFRIGNRRFISPEALRAYVRARERETSRPAA